MHSLYQAYQAYERRVSRDELGTLTPIRRISTARSPLPSLSYRLGDWLVRIGLKLKHQPQAGHALTSTTMAEK